MNTNGSYICHYPIVNPCTYQSFDLIFLLDSSGSIRQQNFDVMLNFVLNVGLQYDIGQGFGQVRVSIIFNFQ